MVLPPSPDNEHEESYSDQPGSDQRSMPEENAQPYQEAVKSDQSSPYYMREEEDYWGAEGSQLSSAYAVPFQLSDQYPRVNAQSAVPGNAPTPIVSMKKPRRLPLFRALVLLVALLGLGGGLAVVAFAQTTPQMTPQNMTAAPLATIPPSQHKPITSTPTSVPPTPTTTGASPTPAAGITQSDWVPQTLPAGWSNAGLTTADAIYALRTAWIFVDREMAIDFRNVGTQGQHGGTLTAAQFIKTNAAKARFVNDERSTDAFFATVEQQQLIQAAINVHPQLMAFQSQGQQQFAWVDVSFQLWQEDTQHLTGMIEVDQANQPLIHHMQVLLLRVIPGTQGLNPPAGGTGWLVSNYELDVGNTPLPIPAQP